jgi:hypothetical protein
MGLSLGGGKTNTSAVAVLQYYPDHGKIFLSGLETQFGQSDGASRDEALFNVLKPLQKGTELGAIDVPLKWPKCLRCRLICPGAERCREPELLWLKKHYRRRNNKRRPRKWLTPYTERCVEFYIANELEEPFHPPQAMGANMAPLTARAHYLMRRLSLRMVEFNPQVSLWRIGQSLQVQKSYLRQHRHSVRGEEARSAIIHRLVERDIAFFYEQDIRLMRSQHWAFDAFIGALTAMLKYKRKVEPRPEGFPRSAAWVELPLKNLEWKNRSRRKG